MAETNRKHASERMRRNNPMRNEESRRKMSNTLKAIGHKPNQRGGNGNPPTTPQALLASILQWPTEVVITPSDGKRPYHYRVDIGNTALMIAVEVDGASHSSQVRQESDRRKDSRLRSLGWKVFRFSNLEVMEHSADCAQRVLSSTLR